MIIEPLPPEAPPQLRISCERYHAMIEKGLLTEADRIELIDGYLLTKISISPTHSGTVNRLLRLLMTLLGEKVIVAVQNPITIHEFSEPEPDLVVAKFRDDFYAGGHPVPEDILFVIEVADTSLAFDRDTKIPLYAASGIAESWLVDLNDREITVFSQPEGAGYARKVTYRGEDSLEISGFAGVKFSVVDVGL